MSRLAPIVCLLAGCTTGRTTLAPAQPTVIRSSLADLVRPLVEPRLAGDGWRGEVLDVARTGQSAANPDEEWDETILRVTFVARDADGDPRLLEQTEMASVLKALRADLRRVVTAAGGDNQDSAEGETFRERWLVCPYSVGTTAGWVKATVGPASHKHEEIVSQLELVIRETPTR